MLILHGMVSFNVGYTVVQCSALMLHNWKILVQIPAGTILCGVCMFFPCMRGLSPGTLAFSHTQKKPFTFCVWEKWRLIAPRNAVDPATDRWHFCGEPHLQQSPCDPKGEKSGSEDGLKCDVNTVNVKIT